MRSIAPSGLSVHVMVLIPLCFLLGCRAANDDLSQAHGAKPIVNSSFTVSGLKCQLLLVSGLDGGRLSAGQEGWIVLKWENTSDAPQQETIGSFYAKSRSISLRPAWLESADPVYAGFGIVQCGYEFRDLNGTVAAKGVIAPPDDPMHIAPQSSIYMWRTIKAPPRPGRYFITFRIDEGDLREAVQSRNFVDFAAYDNRFVGNAELTVGVEVYQ